MEADYGKLYLSSTIWAGPVRLDRSLCEGEEYPAGCVLSSVGSLTRAMIRLANRSYDTEYNGYFEIVSMTGTVSLYGSHLHISISDSDGKTIGGHLVNGCKIYTTAEIVLAVFNDIVYKREFAADSGYDELAVYPSNLEKIG